MSTYKIRTLSFMAFWLIACQFRAGAFEKVHNETRSFAVSPGTEIQISNKYGNVHIINWDKDSVKFEISVVVNSVKQEKVEKTLSAIDFEFTPTSRYIIAKTIFKNNQGSFLDEVNNLANTLFTSSNSVQIDYKVYMPQNGPLKIENKFGNIFMTDFDEKVTITLSNGDLKANEFMKALDLKIDFGSVNLKKVGDCKITAGYAEVEINQAGKMQLDCKSSTFDFEVIETLEINSKRDKINIGKVKSIRGELSFSELRVDDFSATALLNSNYGEIDLRSVDKNFGQINLTAKYTEISLNFDKESAFSLVIGYSKQTALSNTLGAINLKKEVLDEKNGLYQSSGTIGSGKSLPEVKINILSGQVSLTKF